MKIAIALLSTLLCASPALAGKRDRPEKDSKVRVLLSLEEGQAREIGAKLERDLGRKAIRHRYRNLPLLAVEVDRADLRRLRAYRGVLAVEEDRDHRPHLGESVPLVRASAARTHSSYQGGAGVAVAILDTGVDATHPAFGGRVVAEACFSTSGATTTGYCPNGADSDSGSGSAAPCASPACAHGTHVAGIAAGDDGLTRGVAPSADIIAVTVFHWENDNCGTYDNGVARPTPCLRASNSDIIAGIDFVIGQAATRDVAAINLSLGSGDFQDGCDGSQMWSAAVQRALDANIGVIASTGNDDLTDGIESPSCRPGVVSVGNTTKQDVVNSSSNSVEGIDLLAPGTSIFSWAPGGLIPVPMTGTSMAAPHVTGAFALLRHRFPAAGPAYYEGLLEANGIPVTDARNGITTPRLRIPYPSSGDHTITADDIAIFERWALATAFPYLDGETLLAEMELLREFIMINVPCHEVGYMPGAGCP